MHPYHPGRYRSPAWGHRDTETLPEAKGCRRWYIGAIILLIAIVVALVLYST